MKHIIRTLLFIVVLTTGSVLRAQFEPMFTQYMFNELFINPAYAGSRDAMSITGLYRDQWVGLDGSPKTQTLSLHGPLSKNRLGLGFALLNENIGVTTQTGFYLNGAYRIPMEASTLSFGLQLGFLSHQERLSEVSTDIAGDNQFIVNSARVLVPNFGWGAYYQRERFFAGLSIPRLMENKVNVTGAETDVNNKVNLRAWHYFLTSGGVLDLNSSIKVRPTLMMKNVAGAPIEFDLSTTLLFNDFIWAGLAYRTQDAASLLVGAHLTPQWRLGYAYDYTLSELQKFNSGSHEIVIGYDFRFDKEKIVTPRYF